MLQIDKILGWLQLTGAVIVMELYWGSRAAGESFFVGQTAAVWPNSQKNCPAKMHMLLLNFPPLTAARFIFVFYLSSLIGSSDECGCYG